MFEDQTVELLPARTTMKAVGRASVARAPHINLTLVIQYIQVTQVSTGNNSPNSALVILANG